MLLAIQIILAIHFIKNEKADLGDVALVISLWIDSITLGIISLVLIIIKFLTQND